MNKQVNPFLKLIMSFFLISNTFSFGVAANKLALPVTATDFKEDVILDEGQGVKEIPKGKKTTDYFIYSSMAGNTETILLHNPNTLDVHTYITAIGFLMENLGENRRDKNFYNVRFQGGEYAIKKQDIARFIHKDDIQSFPYYVKSGDMVYHVVEGNPFKKESWHLVTNLGMAPSWMKEQQQYYSFDGIYFTDTIKKLGKKESKLYAVNKREPFYSEFLYLPIRTKTQYSSAELDQAFNYLLAQKPSLLAKGSQLTNSGKYFKEAEAKYGVNALLFLSIAINESAYGTSGYAVENNNLFGYNAVDSYPDNADKFQSLQQGIHEVANLLSWSYGDASFEKGKNYYGSHLGNKSNGINVKYASDPFWGEKAVSNMYNIDGMLGHRDTHQYTIGLVKQKAKVYWNRMRTKKAFRYKKSTGSQDFMYPVVIYKKRIWTTHILMEPPFNNEKEVEEEVANAGGAFQSFDGYVSSKEVEIINVKKKGAN